MKPTPPPSTPPPVARWRSPLFLGRCYLCGLPIAPGLVYCRGHKWAAYLWEKERIR